MFLTKFFCVILVHQIKLNKNLKCCIGNYMKKNIFKNILFDFSYHLFY